VILLFEHEKNISKVATINDFQYFISLFY